MSSNRSDLNVSGPAAESSYEPPSWMELSGEQYRRVLNREAVAVTKRDQKRGGSYRVKEALDALHLAFHRSDGRDPYDGLPMDARSLFPSASGGMSFLRCPAVGHRQQNPVADFEVLSQQTRQAKGAMTGEDYLTHCQAVVDHAKQMGRI